MKGLILPAILLSSRLLALDGVGVHLAAGSGVPMGVKADDWEAREFIGILYRGSVADGILGMAPVLEWDDDGKKSDYLKLLADGGTVEPITFSPEYDITFPSLDVRVVNNGRDALHLSKVRLSVAESRVDPEPLPLVFSGYSQVQHLELANEGWGRIEKAEFEFDLVGKEPPLQVSGELPFKRTLFRVEKDAVLPLHEELGKLGVPPALTAAAAKLRENESKTRAIYLSAGDELGAAATAQLAKLEEENGEITSGMLALGKTLKTGRFQAKENEYGVTAVECWITGRITYTWKDGDREMTRKVGLRAPVLILPPEGLGAPGPVSGRYEAMLRESGSAYTVEVPVSQVVKRGDTTRFTVTLGVPKSSLHRFKVALVATDGTEIAGGDVNLKALLPRSALNQLAQSAAPEEEGE